MNLSEHMRRNGSKGGRARAENLSPRRRKQIAIKASLAAAAKRRRRRDDMTMIAGMSADELLMRFNSKATRQSVIAWAHRNDVVVKAVETFLEINPPEAGSDPMEFYFVALLCSKIRSDDQRLEILRNLKPADFFRTSA